MGPPTNDIILVKHEDLLEPSDHQRQHHLVAVEMSSPHANGDDARVVTSHALSLGVTFATELIVNKTYQSLTSVNGNGREHLMRAKLQESKLPALPSR